MINKLFLVVAAVIISTAVAGIVRAGNSVDVKSKDGLGSYLADSRGMTLYQFKNDSDGKSVCAGPCVQKWPLFWIDSVEVPAGIEAGDFGTITRDDGKTQTIYKGKPLYYFAGDKKPGDTNGQGVKDVWFAATP